MAETFLQKTIREHKELREQWRNDGCPKSFYEWLLDRVEKRIKKNEEAVQ